VRIGVWIDDNYFRSYPSRRLRPDWATAVLSVGRAALPWETRRSKRENETHNSLPRTSVRRQSNPLELTTTRAVLLPNQAKPATNDRAYLLVSAPSDARIKSEHVENRDSSVSAKLISLHDVERRATIGLLTVNDDALRDPTAGYLNQYDAWLQDCALDPSLTDRILAFNFGYRFLFCSRRSAEHETHAGDSDERSPNQ
jgi:hypothetical protein